VNIVFLTWVISFVSIIIDKYFKSIFFVQLAIATVYKRCTMLEDSIEF